MSKNIVIKLYTDPGHGWASVKLSIAKELGFLDKISNYSYTKGKSVYLEEDCDLSLYCNAIKANGDSYTVISIHTDKQHPIRSYKSATQQNLNAALLY